MSIERMKFVDINGSLDSTTITPAGTKKGCFVSVVAGFILVLLALAIAVGVGVVIYFAASKKIQCNCQYPSSSVSDNGPGMVTGGPRGGPEAAVYWDMCHNLSVARNECLSGPPHCTAQSSTEPSPTKAPLPKDVRIPDNLIPTHYDVELQPDIYSADPEHFTFNGSVAVYIKCIKPTNVVILHINALTIRNDTIIFRAATRGESAPVWTHWDEDKPRQFFKLHLDGQLAEGSTYVLSMSFTGLLKDDLVGLYRSSYQENNVTRWIAATQFQPTDARKTFPCYDEPAIKATFNITLVRKAPMISLSNMPLIRTEARPGGWLADHFDQTVKMSTYLLAFVVCDFEFRQSTTRNGTMFRVWARREAIGQVDYALRTGVKILEYFETYFSIPFPLPKQDMIAIPDFGAGAMENWGLITYRETALLFDPLVSSTTNKQRVAIIVSHELAHQWFGNLVTPAWWDDLWLNEGFASYVEYIGVNFTHPDWQMMAQFVTDDLQDVFSTDGLGNSHPIFVPVDHPDEINEIFDKISYSKGASIIRMMNFFLGESTFRKGLSNYLRRHQFGNAHHTDLWQALDEQAKVDGLRDVNVKEIMDTWVLQMGYPVITITRDAQKTTAQVTQDHFLLDPSNPPSKKYPSPYNYKWMVPLTYTTSVEQAWYDPIRVWMRKGDVSLAGLPPNADWLIGNVLEQGYFRVNYDLENWNALLTQLKTDHNVIPILNRAQIIDDALSFGRSGLIDQVIGLQATEYLGRELEYLPWEAASVGLVYIDDMLERSGAYGLFQEYMSQLVEPMYNRLGWNNDPDSPHLEKYLRYIALSYACKYEKPDCLTNAARLYSRWMQDPVANSISPDLRTTVYCNGIREGGQAEWDFAHNMYKTANVASEKDKLLFAMSCTRKPWLISRYLKMTLDSDNIRKQDAIFTIVYISRNPIGRFLAWDFVREHWDFMRESFGGGLFAFSRLISGVTSSFNSEFELSQIKQFAKNRNMGSGNRAFEQSIEKTNINIKWMKTNEQKIHRWLQETLNKNRK